MKCFQSQSINSIRGKHVFFIIKYIKILRKFDLLIYKKIVSYKIQWDIYIYIHTHTCIYIMLHCVIYTCAYYMKLRVMDYVFIDICSGLYTCSSVEVSRTFPWKFFLFTNFSIRPKSLNSAWNFTHSFNSSVHLACHFSNYFIFLPEKLNMNKNYFDFFLLERIFQPLHTQTCIYFAISLNYAPYQCSLTLPPSIPIVLRSW